MFPEIKSIKKKRMLAEINQKELARMSNISQSMIAKIESGKIEPSYSIIKKIFSSLDKLEKNENKKCSEIMSKKIYFINSDKTIKNVSKLMNKYSLSQIPVIDKGIIVGKISENILIENLSKMQKNVLFNLKISEIMGSPMPTMDGDIPINTIIPLIKKSGAILILKKEKPIGIITKSDLI